MTEQIKTVLQSKLQTHITTQHPHVLNTTPYSTHMYTSQ